MNELNFARYFKSGLKKYIPIIWCLKFSNIFKVPIEIAMIKYSNFIIPTNIKRFFRKTLTFLNKDTSNIEELFLEAKRQRNPRQKRQNIPLPLTAEIENKIMNIKKEKINNFWSGLTPEQKRELNEKSKQALLKKYGVDNAFKSKELMKKAYTTRLQKYGDANFNNRKKAAETNLKKYGVENSGHLFADFSKIDWKKRNEKSRETCLRKFGYPETAQLNMINFENFNSEFCKKMFIKKNEFDIYEFMKYFNIKSSVTARKYKNIFKITEPSINNLYYTKMQKYIFNLIKTNNKILNYRKIFNGKSEVDIFLPEIKLGIEYNGLMFHSEGNLNKGKIKDINKNYHLNKTEMCENKGIQLFHIFEGENIDLWLSMINNKLGLNKKIYARKCIIKEIDSKECAYFFNENHLQGNISAAIRIGLYYESELVQAMTFGKSRFNKKYDFELLRFCSKKFINVVGGASKLFNYFLIKYNPKSIISYANRRFSQGKIYEVLGFKKIGITKPNYFYFMPDSKDFRLMSRIKFQKHKLKNILANFDLNLSESENMFNNGYRRIYDCGNLVYEFKGFQK